MNNLLNVLYTFLTTVDLNFNRLKPELSNIQEKIIRLVKSIPDDIVLYAKFLYK